MHPLRFLFIVVWTLLVIYPQWGEWAVGILVVGHFSKIFTGLAVFPVFLFDKQGALALRVLLTVLFAFYLMYLSVHWFSWWCFWAIFATFVTLTVEHKRG